MAARPASQPCHTVSVGSSTILDTSPPLLQARALSVSTDRPADTISARLRRRAARRRRTTRVLSAAETLSRTPHSLRVESVSHLFRRTGEIIPLADKTTDSAEPEPALRRGGGEEREVGLEGGGQWWEGSGVGHCKAVSRAGRERERGGEEQTVGH